MYVHANRDSFTDGRILTSGGWDRGEWIIALRSYYYTKMNILRCPMATERRPRKENYGGSFHAYYMPVGGNGSRGGGEEPSYGLNNWLYNPPAGVTEIQGRPTINNWRRANRARHPNRVPVFADTMWRGGGPSEDGSRGAPPAYDSEWVNADAEMRHFCINRHEGYNNHLFLDSSVRRVGLKELWVLKWHRNFNTAGTWTRAAGRRPTDWPAWMRQFPDY